MSFRAALAAALWSMLLLGLGGCSSLPFWPGKAAEDANQPKPPTPSKPQFRLQVDAPGKLRDLLLEYLDLARLQSAPEVDSLTPSELDRLIGAAAVQVRSILETEGYFNPQVQVRREPTVAGELPLVRIDVQPGVLTRVSELTLDIQGALQQSADAGDKDAVALRQEVQRDWPLHSGQPFVKSSWEGAKKNVLATLREQGYLAAGWSGTVAHVDAPTNSATLFLVADSGPRFYLGTPVISGLKRYDSDAVVPIASLWKGLPASEEVLRELQERLLALNLFEGVVVSIEADVNRAAAAPMLVSVRELTLQTATVGVGLSDSVGAKLTLEHTHRQVFGTRWIAINKFQLGTQQSYWQGDLMSYPFGNGYRDLAAAAIEKLDVDDETTLSWHLRAGRTIDGTRILRLYYGEFAQARLQTAAGVNDSRALSANYNWTWRDLDNQRAPIKGVALALQGAAGWTQGEFTSAPSGLTTSGAGPFSRAYARLSGFWPLADSWFGSARLELGEVFVRDTLTVPDTLLFRAGGDESVRGYAYRSLGPQVNGATVGGSNLFTASVQVEHPIWPTQPDFLWALFVDAGNAANSWNDLKPVFGYGAGVHWRSPVGPLRIDLAYGEALRRFRLSFSVGVSF